MSSWIKQPARKKINQINVTNIEVKDSISTVTLTDKKISLKEDVLLEKNTYNELLKKIENFNNINALITFIIPTINRDTLITSLESLLKQNNPLWKAIIIFDNCIPTSENLLNILKNKQFLYFSINNHGHMKNNEESHNSAGSVRNLGISLVTTEWIGFLDDDDSITPDFTDKLLEEIKITPSANLISFRMVNNQQIIPPLDCRAIIIDHIGISFCFKTILFSEGFRFKQSEKEDFHLINDIQIAKHRIVLSPYITYLVNNSIKPYYSYSKRVVIN